LRRVAIVARDLIIATRIGDAATAAGRTSVRVDTPAELPQASSVSVVFVDWADREPGWGEWLAAWCTDAPHSVQPRVVVFGPHSDREAHAEARAAGFGPMLARSRLVSQLPQLVGAPREAAPDDPKRAD
jgi:hypothetical protein